MSHEPYPQRAANDVSPFASSGSPGGTPNFHPATNSAWSANLGQQPAGVAAGSGWGPYPPPSPAPTTRDDNPFEALLDFGFGRYATPGLVKILYVALLVTIALALLFALAVGFTMLADDFTVGIGLLTIFGGLFGAFTAVLLVRVALEYSIAVVRMAGDMARMRERSEADGDPGAGRPQHL